MSCVDLLEAMALPVGPLKKFGRRLDSQLARLERKIAKAIPQLSRRHVPSDRIDRQPCTGSLGGEPRLP